MTPVEVEAERLRTQYMSLDAEARAFYAKIRQKQATLSALAKELEQAEAELKWPRTIPAGCSGPAT